MRYPLSLLFGSLLLTLGCGQVVSLGTGGAAGSTSANAASGGASNSDTGTSGTIASGGSSTAGQGSSGGSQNGSGTSGGSSSGGAVHSPYVDGGYVFCSTPLLDGGGRTYWLCPPGTYLCDEANPGSCFQCLSDSDCANTASPTYDPNRPHCDLGSGVAGYQFLCQQCTINSDCAGNPAGTLCDLSPIYPPGSAGFSIDDVGFETCGTLQTDCRVDGGPACAGLNQHCDPSNGRCETQSMECSSDKDCAGFIPDLYPSLQGLVAPFCVRGICSLCDGGVCPHQPCTNDTDCGNPSSSPSGLTCDIGLSTCACVDSSQCGEAWPICEPLDGGPTNGQGQPLGVCGCHSSDECGDAGLECLFEKYDWPAGSGTCALPCTSPQSPSCRLSNIYPVCDPATGLCGPCTTDSQCQSGVDTGGPYCDFDGGDGNCGCFLDSDCPSGQICGPPPQGYNTLLGICQVELPRCTPQSCNGLFCDWDSGVCRTVRDQNDLPACYTDYDCVARFGPYEPFCEAGQCVECRGNVDCIVNGLASRGEPTCCLPGVDGCANAYPNNYCEPVCASDQDCVYDLAAPSCVMRDAGATCGCASDRDCVLSSFGGHCDVTQTDVGFGYCQCLSNADCPRGEACEIYDGYGSCEAGCYVDGGCGENSYCDPTDTCRPRCDDGNSCQGPDQICDTQNVAGQNGRAGVGLDTSAPGTVWCYSCLSASDCTGGLACDPLNGCGACSETSECPSGTVCIDGGICQPGCDGGSCSNGQVCDVDGLAGYGPDVCYQCVTPADCPNGEGCDSWSHTCGTCNGPTFRGGPFDCPPAAICSNYWDYNAYPGVCLPSCDFASCPADQPVCAVLPGLSPDHKFCFGCLDDADCSALGGGAWCEIAPFPSFTCQTGPRL